MTAQDHKFPRPSPPVHGPARAILPPTIQSVIAAVARRSLAQSGRRLRFLRPRASGPGPHIVRLALAQMRDQARLTRAIATAAC